MIKKTKGFYDGIANHEELKQLDDDNILVLLQETYPDRGLYGFGTSWQDDSKYICKARGKFGDVILGWEGVHDGKVL